ncbi:L,D-transpeptidase [Streptomonospora nanhaiensis]|uniref:L,D-transpeptidase n=1 Tax=Streptomonospora nanhaiensis TaxID=1323731 RepID=UPI001C389D36|nr:L,D-transpeptidase [Streptomonospora nanhaiensis]MBV2363684.1 L,D-transpeptidase [Streptomonospora nanhaiensis]
MNPHPLTRRFGAAVRGAAAPALAALLLALAGCSSDGASDGAAEQADTAPTSDASAGRGQEPARIATATGSEIDVHAEPDGAVTQTLASPNDFGADRTFLIEDERGEWLEVLLPVRPNGSTGWVRASDVSLSTTTLSLHVDLGDFAFRVLDGGEEVRSGDVAIGTEDTPTPPGRYYFTELLRPPEPDGDYGAYAFGLSGFSPTLEEFAGGPGQLAVHGTDDESGLGGEVSHGCIRVANDDITWMAENLPLGTPVEVTE